MRWESFVRTAVRCCRSRSCALDAKGCHLLFQGLPGAHALIWQHQRERVRIREERAPEALAHERARVHLWHTHLRARLCRVLILIQNIF